MTIYDKMRDAYHLKKKFEKMSKNEVINNYAGEMRDRESEYIQTVEKYERIIQELKNQIKELKK
tara:strand:- start:1276 stop:1467 length:192 start_codon:yes stop_codon:yes gene_type:complete